jgi:hypothetical protein
VAEVTGLDHGGRTFDRRIRIDTCRSVDVDVVEAEVLHGVGLRRRMSEQPACGTLHADENFVPRSALEHFTDQYLIVAHAVDVAGIDYGR